MSGVCIRKERCPRCAENGNDKAGDNLAIYDDGGAYCFACGYNKKGNGVGNEFIADVGVKKPKTPLTQEIVDHIRSNSFEGNKFRGIFDDIYKTYNVRNETEYGRVIKQYYPYTKDNKLCGYKVRQTEEKRFEVLGEVNQTIDLFGQHRFKNSNSKYIVIAAGEVDAMSAFQILKQYYDEKSSGYESVPVVSPSVSENACEKQIKLHYEWFKRFDKIYVCFDPDDTGIKYAEKVAKCLPPGKAFMITLDASVGDTNDYLVKDKQKLWMQAFHSAKKYTPTGVVGSDGLYDEIVNKATTKKLTLPPFMKKVNDLTAGGFPLGRIINIGAASGAGKTSIVNEIIYHWIFNSPYTIGVVSMELDRAEYGEVMLSRHIGKKLALMEDGEDKKRFLSTGEIKDASQELFRKPDGSPRWYLVEGVEDTSESLKSTVEQLIISCDCKVIVIDPLQDILDGMSNDEQAVFMKWQKALKKNFGITIININHVRKSGAGAEANSSGAFITEEDFAGSSTIFKSADFNLLMMRNKYHEDLMIRNTTYLMASKCRWTGNTGPCGELFYHNESHTLWDKDEFMDVHGMAQEEEKADF